MHKVLVIAVLLLLSLQTYAQRLPIRSFQTGDGLPHNSIKRIFQDAKGYLWIATWEGLSRFDGYSFTNYDSNDGLGHMFINDVTADAQGRLWAATNGGGVSMLVDEPDQNPSSERKVFVSFHIVEGGENDPSNFVNRMIFDSENRLWCVTDGGLFHALSTKVSDRAFERVAAGVQPTHASAALRDSRGRLWFGISGEIDIVLQVVDGVMVRHELRADSSDPPSEIHTIIEDSSGRILAADLKNIFEFVGPSVPGQHGAWRMLPIGSSTHHILTIAAAPDRGLWIGTSGLVRVRDGRQTLYTAVNGLGGNNVQTILPDREGNLWIGTSGGGVNKMSGEAVVSYRTEQGLPHNGVNRIIEDREGRMYAQMGCIITKITDDSRFIPHDGDKLVHQNCPYTQLILQDAQGGWWFSTARGLEYSSNEMSGGTIIRDEQGSPIQHSQLYEDTEGTVWLTSEATGKLYRINHNQKAILVAENVPAEFIVRDRTSGTVWLANRGRLWRVRNGQVSDIKKIEGLAIIQPRSLFQDAMGRMWIGTRYQGAFVSEEPDASEVQFRRYSTAQGLVSDTIWEIAEDDDGRIYFGTGRGLSQLDMATGRLHHFTADEGAIVTSVHHLLKDRRGRIWAATENGIMRIEPRSMRKAHYPPPIFISQVRIAGETLPLAETGAVEVPPLDLMASRNNLAIRYVGLSFQGEDALRYEYKLEGVDTDWIAAGKQREVNYANLASGNYRFSVRAVDSENVASVKPAVMTFRILSPVYLRWWFIAATTILVASLIYLFYRNRLQRMVEVERTRTRIATDLHDDIGSDLSKISLLSDLARMGPAENPAERDRMLATIADISRSSVDAMRDIVWAINPQLDSVLEMTRRMRKHAEDIFVDRDVSVNFNTPVDGGNVRLPMDVRRELYLIFKEAVNNAARHSKCTAVTIAFTVEGSNANLTVADDGRGFDSTQSLEGNGLANMRKRAEGLGGSFSVSTGEGTRIEVVVPTAGGYLPI